MWEEAVTEPGCSASKAAEPLSRVQQRKQSMVRVGGVSADVMSSGQAAFFAISLMGGCEVPMIFSTVLTTLCRDFQSEALQDPDQTEMQLVSMRSIVPL